MKRLRFLWMLGSLCVAMAGSVVNMLAQGSLTKSEAVARALSNNYGIRVAGLQVEAASVNNTWGTAGALPQVGINAVSSSAVSDQSENPTSFIQERLASESVNFGGQVSWTLFDGMGMFANKRSLEAIEAQSEGQAMLVIEQTVEAVMLGYDEVLVQEALLAVLKASCALSRDRLTWLERKADLGSSGTFERLQFENSLLADSTAYIRQTVARTVAMRNLNRLLGESEDYFWQLTSPLESPRILADRDVLDREVRSNTTGVTNALLAEEITRIGVDQARSRLYPVLGLSSSFGDQRSEFSAGELSGSGRTVNTAASLSLNFNLFNGGTTRRAIQQAQIQVEMAALDVENQQQAASQVFRNAWDRYQTQAAVHGLNERALSNARQTLKMAEERLAYGTITSFEFRDVQINLLRSEAEVLRSLQAWLAAWTGVQRLRGALRTSLKEE